MKFGVRLGGGGVQYICLVCCKISHQGYCASVCLLLTIDIPQCLVIFYAFCAVWPDVGLKSSQISSKGCSENNQSRLYLKSDTF